MTVSTDRVRSSANMTATVTFVLAAGSVIMGVMALLAVGVKLDGAAGTLVGITACLAVAALTAFAVAVGLIVAVSHRDSPPGDPLPATLQTDR